MKSIVRVLIFLAVFCLVFLGCKKSTDKNISKNGGFILGFSQIGAESAWRNCHTRSVQDAAAGVQLLYFNAEQKQENQIKALRSFIAYQVVAVGDKRRS